MMDNHHLRGIILKLEDRLSDHDRKRLHFFLGNDVPRRIRDDPSLGGTLSLMESLFDQDKINENDFTFLINAFDEIKCMDAVKLLREHMRRIQSNQMHESIQSLGSIMPRTMDHSIEAQDIIDQPLEADEEDDKYAIQSRLITQLNSSGNNSEPNRVDHQPPPPNQKKLLNSSLITRKYVLLFILVLLIIGLTIGMGTSVIIIRFTQSEKERKIKDAYSIQSVDNQTMQELINQLQQSRNEQKNQTETIRRLNNQIYQSIRKQIKQNETIDRLKNAQSIDKQIIWQLDNQSKELFKQQTKNDQTIQQLNDQLHQSHNKQTKQNETIQDLNTLRSADNRTIQQLTNELHHLRTKPSLSTTTNVSIVKNALDDSEEDADIINTSKQGQADDGFWNVVGRSCGCPNSLACHNKCRSKFGGTLGKCSGIVGLTCECLIDGVWKSKASQCNL